MGKKTDTWMPLYVSDYLVDTMHLSTEQHGAYCLLIMACWKAGGELQADDAQLAAVTRLSIARWKAHRHVLMAFFQSDGTHVRHRRVTAELQHAAELNDQRSAAGKASAAQRERQRNGNETATSVATEEPTEAQRPKPPSPPSPPDPPIPHTPRPSPSPPSPSASGIDAIASQATGAAYASPDDLLGETADASKAKANGHSQPCPDCPQQVIVALYREYLPTLRQPAAWDGKRAVALRERWRECSLPSSFGDGYSTQAEGVEFWRRFFEFVGECPKLRDGITSRENGEMRTWKPSLDWLVTKGNFLKVIEGNYA